MENATISWNEFWLKEALLYAQMKATDPSTQNGAVLVDSKGAAIACGANHFPQGVRESSDRWERPTKYSYVEHAERNVIYAAARSGARTMNSVMYCPWFACADCARAIVQAGVREMVGLVRIQDETNVRWNESVAIGDQILREGGVKITLIEKKFEVKLRRDGKLVEF